MPKIVLKVDRKANTRSRTQDDKRDPREDSAKVSPTHTKNRSITPKKSSVKQEPRSTITRIQRAPIKFSDRKFFTVQEDWVILNYFKEHESDLTSRSIAEHLAKKVKHSVESIRDRIKRFLSKLRPMDEHYIKDEAKNNPGHYVHFAKENHKKKRSITYINSTLPKLAGSTLQLNERKAIVKQQSRLWKQRFGPTGALKSSSNEKIPHAHSVQNMSTDDLFRLRDERDRNLQEKCAEYSVKLRKRNPKEYRDPTEFLSPVIKQNDSRREFFRSKAERERDNRHDLQSRVDGFLEQLKSSKEEDVEVNAHVLAEIMRNFSSTFGVSNDKITTLLSQEDGGVNVEELRKKLVAQGQ